MMRRSFFQDLVKELEERKLIIERKWLELCGLKEQRSHSPHFRRNLEDKMAVIGMLNGAIDPLQDEVNNLEEEIRQVVAESTQPQMAKQAIEELQKMKMKMEMDSSASNMRCHIVMLEEKVTKFHSKKAISIEDDDMIQKKLKSMEMQRMNKELEMEKRELKVKLLEAQVTIKPLPSNREDETNVKVKEEEISFLKHTNESLSEEVERLLGDQFDMVEELIYQRWLNVCLRFETQNYQTQSRKTSSSNLRDNASLKSHPKAKLVLFSSSDRSSSFTSSIGSNDTDSCSTTESSSSSQRSVHKKFGLVRSIKACGRSKGDSSNAARISSRRGLVRRHSTSVIPSKPSLLSSTSNESWKNMVPESTEERHDSSTPSLAHARRASFSDSSVETYRLTFQDAPISTEQVTYVKEMCITQDSG